MAESFPHYYDVDVTKWAFGESKKNANGQGSNIRLKQSSSSMSSPQFILERMRSPFGIQEPYVGDEAKGERAPVENSTRRNMNMNVESPQLLEWLTNLDEHLIQWATTNSASIFGRVIKRSTIEDVVFFRSLRPSKNPNYPPSFRVKVNIAGDKVCQFLINIPGTSEFFRGTPDDVVRGSEVIPTVLAYHLWVTPNQFGVLFLATHLLVFPPAQEEINPYAGFKEVPRPPPRAALPAPTPTPTSAPAATATEPSVESFNYEDDPSDMY